MKHNIRITVFLLAIFILTQVFGLFLIKEAVTVVKVNGTVTLEHQDTALGERPDMQGSQSFIFLLGGVLIGTGLVLLIIKFGKVVVWKAWYFIAVFLSISLSLGVLVDFKLAYLLAIILAVIKMSKKNPYIHNLTEVLIYSGLAVLMVPLFDIFWASMLLIFISFYDMYAVWKSKHMVKMANFQAKTNLFAGLFIPYNEKKEVKPKLSKQKAHSSKANSKVPTPAKLISKSKNKSSSSMTKNAVLGGGDIAFPLIFSGVVMEKLMRSGIPPEIAFLKVLIISLLVTISLGTLFYFAKKDKFYPAMPFVSAGCFLGLLIVGW